MDRRDVNDSLRSDYLGLIVLPTEACNLRCPYCYEDHAAVRMSQSTENAILRLIDRAVPRLSQFDLSWFGGEPLLAAETVTRVTTHARDVSAIHGLRFRSDITTNATRLKPGVADALLAAGVRRFQITFDGDADWHDRTRVAANGGPTFETIWSNAVSLAQLGAACEDFALILRVHVHRFNADSVAALCERIRDEFAWCTWVSVLLKPVEDLGGSTQVKKYVDLDGRNAAIQRGSEQLGASVSRYDPGTEICYAARLNVFVIRADARVAKCTVALDSPLNNVGSLTKDGELVLNQESLRWWGRGIQSGREDELSCPWKANVEDDASPLLQIRARKPR